MTNKIKRWSYSAYSQWSKCPAQYAYQRFDRLKPDKTSPALERGTRIHSLGEDYLRGTVQQVPKPYEVVYPMLTAAKDLGYVPEQNWAIDSDWQPCDWNNWNVNWGMAKTDAHYFFDDENVLSIVDFKTGRIYPDHEKQASVYAAFGLSYYPDAEMVEVEFWYLDQKDSPLGDSPFHYTREEVEDKREEWNDRALRMMASTRFPHKPSRSACRFCDFRSDKTLEGGVKGPCEEWQDVD